MLRYNMAVGVGDYSGPYWTLAPPFIEVSIYLVDRFAALSRAGLAYSASLSGVRFHRA